MNYEQKYKEALERAKNFIENGDETERTIAESIFAGIMEKSEDEKIRKDILCYFEHYAHDIKGADVQKWISWLEKQVEQKPADNVEPKFHIGEWLQYRNAKPFFVEEITKQGYCNGNSCLPFEWEDEIYPWTIQDAKDGDVLVASDGSLFILSKVVDTAAFYYFSLCKNGSKEISDGNRAWETTRCCQPATKEQRYTLEMAMANAGYRWNKEKLKLEKL